MFRIIVGHLLPLLLVQWHEAVGWLTSATDAGTVPHRLLLESGVLVVEVERPLRAEDFDALALTVDPWIETRGDLRGLVVHARAFTVLGSVGVLAGAATAAFSRF